MSENSEKRGERFGRYLLLEQIGRGGMAEVFRAVAHGVEGFQRVFVLKRILKDKSASQEFIDMFVSEARISALLNHPNIVQIYDFGQIGGSYFLTMEYLRGKDLLSVMRQLRATGKHMSPGVAAFIAQQVALGLHYAHSLKRVSGEMLNIVHRDISPSNIMLLRQGSVKLLDFGIAKAAFSAAEKNRRSGGGTDSGVIKGKLSYLSPEQVRSGTLDGRSDVFALGVVLWEMLTGRRLFYDKNDFETMKNVLERPIPPPSTQRNDVTTALDYIVIRALERGLDRRYPDAKTMADDLTAYLEETHYSQQSLAKLLDDLFGEDAGMYDAQVPESIDMTPVPLPGPDELIGQHQSASLPPMQVETSASKAAPSAVVRTAVRRRRAQVAVGGTALMVAGALLAVLFARRPDSTPPPVSASPPPPNTAPVAAPPHAPALPASVLVRVQSDPPGADVVDVSGEHLGVTPTEIVLPRGTTGISLLLRKAGYEELRQVVVPDRDTTATVTLKPADLPPPRPVGKPVRGPAKPRLRAGTTGAAPPSGGDGKVKEAITIDPFEDGSSK